MNRVTIEMSIFLYNEVEISKLLCAKLGRLTMKRKKMLKMLLSKSESADSY